MNDFKKALSFTLAEEGGYSNHIHDKGGKTMMGITAETLARAYKASLVSCKDVESLTREDAEEIYRCFYWEPSRASAMPWPLSGIHFDAAVNHGVGGAGKLLQRALNALHGSKLAVDGAIGPLTLKALFNALETYSVKTICESYLNERKILYEKILKRDETQKDFRRGWFNRLERNRKLVERNAL